ncbi:MAG: peptidylprolyl isomerase [Nitrosomonas sp.]|nr:peptidylprolyl isomerase [Nitrosomonas sp.]
MKQCLLTFSKRLLQIQCLLLVTSASFANSVACFNSNMGAFCIELFESHTPITTANFLTYINNGSYTNGVFHRSVFGFVVQGGGYRIVDNGTEKTLVAVTTLPQIKNEFKISNTRGTVAMAKLPDIPDSATSQWFVNLADNSKNLDFQNGGFTVFGRVVFDGMAVFDAIATLPKSGGGFPFIDSISPQPSVNNLVQISDVTVKNPTGVFHENIASFAVDIGDGTVAEVKLKLINSDADLLFELDSESIKILPAKPTNVATFLPQSGLVSIPSIMINQTTMANNIRMELVNTQPYQFVLKNYELSN